MIVTFKTSSLNDQNTTIFHELNNLIISTLENFGNA